jgi:hypothetical protein
MYIHSIAMIDVATLSEAQKGKLQRILEINTPLSYGILEVALGRTRVAPTNKASQ